MVKPRLAVVKHNCAVLIEPVVFFNRIMQFSAKSFTYLQLKINDIVIFISFPFAGSGLLDRHP